MSNARSTGAPSPRGSLAWQQRCGAWRRAASSSSGSVDAAAAHAAAAAATAGRDATREVAVLGGEDFILSQRSGVEEDLFKGQVRRAEGCGMLPALHGMSMEHRLRHGPGGEGASQPDAVL